MLNQNIYVKNIDEYSLKFRDDHSALLSQDAP